MSISILFSFVIYQISSNQLSTRFGLFQTNLRSQTDLPAPTKLSQEFRDKQTRESEEALLISLFYINFAVLGIGGIASYFFARKSLLPIEASHEAQSRFTSDASHELRTPLAVMKSELEVALRDKNLPKQELRQILASTLEEVDRLSNLTHVLLQFSRQDYQGFTRTETDVNKLAERTVTMLNKHQSRVKLTAPEQPVIVSVNEASIRELLTILLDNALRYSPPKSDVTVQIRNERTVVIIAVGNRGKGIHPDDLPHIFDRFYRGDKSRTSSSTASGYGLGLSLAKKIVELHGAQLSITSAPGRMTTAKIVLPKSI